LALVQPEQQFAGIAGREAMLSNSFAFGGSNIALVLGRSEAV
jgi:3-oxoacyl-(acyl-carrier-protein) synthase